VTLGGNVEWQPAIFPEPHTVEQETGGTVNEHTGTIVVYARGTPGRAFDEASLEALSVELDGLTCSDVTGLCITWFAELERDGSGPDEVFEAFPEAVAASSPDAGTDSGPGGGEGDGLWLFLLAAVGWGLFTLLMPCTYPMIPITISFFTKQADARKGSVLPLSLTYGAGIIAIFVLIGVVIGPVIIDFAVHPVTNLVIGSMFLLFALVLFGMMELNPPAFLMNVAGKASMRGGYVGVFLMGVTLVVTSFTCTAPFVGSLLALGAGQGGVGRIALGMAVFGATMAIPFVLLSLVPGKLQAMPRSGEWMNVLKVFLGFVEVAAALKFISNADLVWQWKFLSREVFLVLWFGIFIVAALFLFGMIRLKSEDGSIGPGRMVGGLLTFLFALYCGFGSLGNSMDPIMTAIIPPYSSQEGGGGKGGGLPAATHTIIKDDYEEAIRVARKEGKGVLVNFTGYT
jgi:thiol:disulfide interchange protein DsbD